MKVVFPNITIDFLDLHSEGEAMDHARVLVFEDVNNLPRPYKLVDVDKTTNTYSVTVYEV